ncbi:MAG: hypothetical protein WCD52_19545, partial [Xanthobacteraceae bacterium]
QTFYRHFLDEIPAVATQYEIIDLMNLSMSELKRRLGILPDATGVIYTGIYYDNVGVSHVPAELVTQIAEWANRPVVINVASYLGKGAVGGRSEIPETNPLPRKYSLFPSFPASHIPRPNRRSGCENPRGAGYFMSGLEKPATSLTRSA